MNTILTYNDDAVKLSVAQIESLPNYRHKGNGEYSAVCPNPGCDSDEDAFLFWPEVGNYWCRKCGLDGFVTDKAFFTITPEIQAKVERQRKEQEQAEHENHLTAIETLQKKRPDILYHKTFIDGCLYELVKTVWGVEPANSDQFNLGYCNICPTYQKSDSITLPYYWSGQLVNLRHRLLEPNGSGKYRPEMAGLPSAIFNADRLQQDLDYLILVEGEFKAIVLEQQGLPTVAIPGANVFKEKWVRLFHKADIVYIALDPGVNGAAIKIGVELAKSGVDTRLVTMPVKPDDFFTIYHGSRADFEHYLRLGKRI